MKDIKLLLQRYYDGETSLEEETYLQQYLAEHPDADPASAALMTDLGNMIAPGRERQPQKKRIRLSHQLWAATAVAAAVTALFCLRGGPVVTKAPELNTVTAQLLADPSAQGEIKDEARALEQARKALSYVSAQLNKGTQGIRRLDQLEESVDKIQNQSL